MIVTLVLTCLTTRCITYTRYSRAPTYYSLKFLFFFFFNDTATTEIYTLSLHDALPISRRCSRWPPMARPTARECRIRSGSPRSEEHTSELQSPDHLVCRLLLEKKKKKQTKNEILKNIIITHDSTISPI